MKKLILESIVTPDVPGYADRYALCDDDDCRLLLHGSCSCCPNPTRPSTGLSWAVEYAWAECGTYHAECVTHPRYGKCILIADGRAIPARFLNPNKRSKHYNAPWLDEVFIHSGESNTWRGSAGCPTLPPDEFNRLIAQFDIGEILTVAIVDFSKMKALVV